MGHWKTYNNRISINGSTTRERRVNEFKDKIVRKVSTRANGKSHESEFAKQSC